MLAVEDLVISWCKNNCNTADSKSQLQKTKLSSALSERAHFTTSSARARSLLLTASRKLFSSSWYGKVLFGEVKCPNSTHSAVLLKSRMREVLLFVYFWTSNPVSWHYHFSSLSIMASHGRMPWDSLVQTSFQRLELGQQIHCIWFVEYPIDWWMRHRCRYLQEHQINILCSRQVLTPFHLQSETRSQRALGSIVKFKREIVGRAEGSTGRQKCCNIRILFSMNNSFLSCGTRNNCILGSIGFPKHSAFHSLNPGLR